MDGDVLWVRVGVEKRRATALSRLHRSCTSAEGARWRIVTFEDPDFIAGFTTELPANEHHVLHLAVFAATPTPRPHRWR